MAAVRLPVLVPKGAEVKTKGKAKSNLRMPTPLDFQQAADRLLLRKFVPPGVLVNKDMDVLQFRGRTSPFLELPQAGTTLNLARMAQESLSLELLKAIQECEKSGAPVHRPGLSIMDCNLLRKVDVEVQPLTVPGAGEVCYLVLFDESEKPIPVSTPAREGGPDEGKLSQLLLELAAAREHLQTLREQCEVVNEEMKSSSEEMESSNEELQSTNEELETAKEELQSGNEELGTMNEELRSRNQELGRLNDDLTNLLRSVQIPIVMLGADLAIRRFTPAAAEAWRLTTADIGKPIGKVKIPIPNFDLQKLVRDVMASPSHEVASLEIRDQDGHWFALKIHPYHAADDSIDGALVVVLDIDELKQTQQRLKNSGDFARSIVDTVREPLLILEKDLRIHSANLSYYHLFGGLPQDTEGVSIQAVGGGRWSIPELVARLQKSPDSEKPFEDFEVVYGPPEGRQSTYSLNARRLLENGGNTTYTLLAINDITERVRAQAAQKDNEEKLRQSQRMEAIGRLAGGVAHDFNNLLTIINGYGSLCLSLMPEDGDLHKHMKEILKAGDLAAALTGQLLAYSRKQVLMARSLNLNEIVANMHSMLTRLIGERYSLVLELDDALNHVKADPGQMEQVMVNLIVNARDASPSGGDITVKTENANVDAADAHLTSMGLRGDYVVLSVKDSGIGMDADMQKHIFDPFFTTKEIGKGTGLGLSVVQGIVSQSEGYVAVESKPDIGSTFKIYLPREASNASPKLPKNEKPIAQSNGTETILLVEDEEAVRNLIQKILAMNGYTVLEAESGKAALRLNEKHKKKTIQLLLTDMVMPGMGGREVADLFMKTRPESSVLFMSGYTEDAIFNHTGVLRKDQNFIPKPFTPTALANAVREVLDFAREPLAREAVKE